MKIYDSEKKMVIIEEVKPKIERNMNWNVIQKKKKEREREYYNINISTLAIYNFDSLFFFFWIIGEEH